MKKASELFRTVHNPDGPDLTTVNRKIIEKDGLYFKDIDGSGEFRDFDDWRLPPEERAASYVKELTTDEKIGQLFSSDWHMGKDAQDPSKLDETGILDEGVFVKKNIFGEQHLPGTTDLLTKIWARHLIFRPAVTTEEMTDFFNQLHAVAESCDHFVPVQCLSNSRNENGEVVFGMNDGSGSFATWPGTLGIAAAQLGELSADGVERDKYLSTAQKEDTGSFAVVDRFAECIRREWNAVGLRKGYMYMADVVTDPRWQRTYGTFGECPELIEAVFERIIPRIQGSKAGVTDSGVAMTIKHFPGGGARENGFDPHYKAGQWNVYQTEGSLAAYHLPPFTAAIRNNASSIMPYYSKPSGEKSAPQRDLNGELLPLTPQGFAYNHTFIQDVLRNRMGFKGYINSDTGIVHNMSWGVEALDIPERIAYALNNGVDLIGGMFDVEDAKTALRRTAEGYYDTHAVPEGFTREELEVTEDTIDKAVTRTLSELFALGMFENPYRSVAEAVATVSHTESDRDDAAAAHRKSVVLLKNNGVKLSPETFRGHRIYAECFMKNAENAAAATASLRRTLAARAEAAGFALCEDPAEADFAFFFVTPSSGAYFNATPGYLELDLCDGKVVPDVDEAGKPTANTHLETTVADMQRLIETAAAVHKAGGRVFASLNVTLAWMPGNLERIADVLTCGFDTYPEAVLDIFLGLCKPSGKLPLTLPAGDAVLAVNSDGVCISPNDVPGFDKDLYLPDSLKDENGKGYAYRDSAGNYYTFGFGL